MNKTEWWYETNGEQKGPVSKEQLQALIKCGDLKQTNLVWTEGLIDWITVNKADLIGTTNGINKNDSTDNSNNGNVKKRNITPVITVVCICLPLIAAILLHRYNQERNPNFIVEQEQPKSISPKDTLMLNQAHANISEDKWHSTQKYNGHYTVDSFSSPFVDIQNDTTSLILGNAVELHLLNKYQNDTIYTYLFGADVGQGYDKEVENWEIGLFAKLYFSKNEMFIIYTNRCFIDNKFLKDSPTVFYKN